MSSENSYVFYGEGSIEEGKKCPTRGAFRTDRELADGRHAIYIIPFANISWYCLLGPDEYHLDEAHIYMSNESMDAGYFTLKGTEVRQFRDKYYPWLYTSNDTTGMLVRKLKNLQDENSGKGASNGSSS